ncbi:MAG: molybdopterin-synthase adenylyltransferase MoeB [Gammaproteobacteria bacterium]|jgi:molybdopterin-synthase adenylyltransferase
MDHDALLRYSRQILLPAVGLEGQERLLDSRVLIVGAGGLGSPAALYLAAAGVGHITIADHDEVDLSNLQRQLLHRHQDLGRLKVDSARDSLQSLNPDVSVSVVNERLAGQRLDEQVSQVDLVVDASDNFTTRFAINAACVRHRVPLVSGAAIRMEGQVAVFRPGQPESPCYRCLYKEADEPDQTCASNGVLAPVVGVIGSLQALEAIKVLLDLGESLCGRLLLFDATSLEWRTLRLRKDPACPVCGNPP